jgi:EAL domain-containing protein (putative c-di-GMP-specific phosphodiesterase class I)
LKDTDFNIVKLDKSFVDHLDSHVPKDEVMLRGMVSMLSGIGVEVVAEGVETKEQATFVKDLNCDVIQGYYFDKPMPASEFIKRLKKRVYD